MDSKLRKITDIRGTKLSANNTQLLISTGIPSLDVILGGGLPIGTITLIEEDIMGTYSKIMLQYFLAEGTTCSHSLFVASQETSPKSIVTNLPVVIVQEENESTNAVISTDDKLKIAWRYQYMPTAEQKSLKSFGHFYDLSKKIDANILEKLNITYWDGSSHDAKSNIFINPMYHDLLKNIKYKIDEEKLSLKPGVLSENVLRIGLHSLGSPLWLPPEENKLCNDKDFVTFMYCLRSLLRSSCACAVITIPNNIEKHVLSKCVHLSDTVLRLETFTGTELEKNPVLSDYKGFFKIVKISAISTLVAKDPGPIDFAFKLRIKKFTIEKLHLPPDIQDPDDQNEIPSMGCGSSSKHLLEF